MTSAALEHVPAETPAPKKRRRKLVVRVLQMAVAAVALWWLFTHVPVSGVAEAMLGSRPLPIAAALGASLLAQVVVASRLKRLTDAHALGLTTPQVVSINLSTMFYALFVPAGNFVGIAVRFYRLAGAERKIAAAAVALLLDRIAATATLCVVGAAFWALERPAGTELVPVALAAVLLAMTLLIALLATPVRVPGTAGVMAALLRVKKLRTLREALTDSRALPRSAFLPVAGLSLLAHLLGVVGYWLVALAVGLNLDVVSAGWLRSAMILAAMMPVSFAGLGVREGTAVALLAASYGIAGEEALAFSLLVFATTVLFPAIIGGLIELRRAREAR